MLLGLSEGRFRVTVHGGARKRTGMRRCGYHSGYHFRTLPGGQERVEARPVLPLRAGRILVDEDIPRVDRPALRRGVRGPALDLACGRARLRVPVAVVRWTFWRRLLPSYG